MLNTDFVLGFPANWSATTLLDGVEYPVGIIGEKITEMMAIDIYLCI